MGKLKKYVSFLQELAVNYSEDRISTWSAALSYYTIFSITPLLLISIGITGFFFGDDIAQSKILEEFGDVFSEKTINQIQLILQNFRLSLKNYSIRIIGVLVLIYGASGFFSELQGGLNYIWRAKAPTDSTVLRFLKNRFLTFVLVLIIALILLLSIFVSTILTGLNVYYANFYGSNYIAIGVEFLASFVLIAFLTSLIFKILPHAQLTFKEVIVGGLWTSFLFNIGKILLSIYIARAQITTLFGVTGSFLVLLVWVYYSAQIFFIGAEITKLLFVKDTQKGLNQE